MVVVSFGTVLFLKRSKSNRVVCFKIVLACVYIYNNCIYIKVRVTKSINGENLLQLRLSRPLDIAVRTST